MERAIEVDINSLVPQQRILFPDHSFMGRTYAVVADQYLNRAQPCHRLSHGIFATFPTAQIRHDIVQAQRRQFRLGARRHHHTRPSLRQQLRAYLPDSSPCAGHQSDPSFHSCHYSGSPLLGPALFIELLTHPPFDGLRNEDKLYIQRSKRCPAGICIETSHPFVESAPIDHDCVVTCE